jgi:hypothetical protein
MAGLDFDGIVNALVSKALQLGVFERVNAAEPKNKPGSGITGAVWLRSVAPAARRAGLSSTSVLLTFTFRVYTSASQDPPDAIDPAMYKALAALMTGLSGGFALGGLVQQVDLLGAMGTPLQATTGYIQIGDMLMRTADLTIPLIVNDVFDQAE